MAFELPQPRSTGQSISEQTQRLISIILAGSQRPDPVAEGIRGGFGLGAQAIQQAGSVITEGFKARRRQQLAAMAAAGDRSALFQLGIVPPEGTNPLPAAIAKAGGFPEGITESQARTLSGSPSFKAQEAMIDLDPEEQKFLGTNKTKVTKEEFKALSGLKSKSLTIGTRGDQFDRTEWDKVVRLTNPAIAPRGSLLGTAGQLNARANRALKTLNSERITPQIISNAVTDLTGIMQGGAPHDVELKQQAYGNIFNDIANLRTRITGKPSDANTPEIVNELKRVISEVVQVDNQVIGDNLASIEASQPELISRNPQKWIKYKASILGSHVVEASSRPAAGRTGVNDDPLGILGP